MKTILTMTYLFLIFVFGAVRPLICASIVTPSFGKARLWVVARLRPRKNDIWCYDWSQHQLEENVRFFSASKLAPDCPRQATTAQRRYYLPYECQMKLHSGGALGARKWQWKGKFHAIAMASCHFGLKWSFLFWTNSTYPLKTKIGFVGAFGSPKRTHSRGKFPQNCLIQEERRKKISPWWCCCYRQFWP